MSDAPKSSDADTRPARPDFDLIEDIGDAASFDRALDELLPKGELSLGGRVDIDPDDFEAFNRELDAQMAQAKARAGRRGAIVEDLGTDVVDGLPAATTVKATPTAEIGAASAEEPAVADDVVTLGTIAAAMAAPPAATVAALPPAKGAVAPAAPVANPAPPRKARAAGVTAVALGLAGLVAGAAALWLSLERGAELNRLREALGERQAVVNPPAPADQEHVRELEQRLEEVNRRVAALSAPAPAADSIPKAAPPQPVAEHEPAGAAPPSPSALPAPAPAIPLAESGRAETTPAATPSQGVPKPSGTGPWAVVIDSYADEAVAEQRRAQVQRMGVPAEVRWFLVKEQVRYRVVVPGYATQDAANNAAAELRRRKVGGAWVMRLPKRE